MIYILQTVRLTRFTFHVVFMLTIPFLCFLIIFHSVKMQSRGNGAIKMDNRTVPKLHEKIVNITVTNRAESTNSIHDISHEASARSSEFTEQLVNITKLVHKAAIHAKSIKTQIALNEVSGLLENTLASLGLNYTEVTSRKLSTPISVCPEQYKHATEDEDPSLPHGWYEINCTHSVPLYDLVTMVSVMTSNDQPVSKFVKSIRRYHSGLKIILFMPAKAKPIEKFHDVVYLFDHDMHTTTGKQWSSVLQKVDTKYVLFVRNSFSIDDNVDLKHMIRMQETHNIAAVAGSMRDIKNKTFHMGCYQTALRNYNLVYAEGYDESVDECLLCDYTDSSFLMQRSTAMKTGFDIKINDYGVFDDFFLRLGYQKIVLCPNSMFQVHRHHPPSEHTQWHSFINKWDIRKVSYSSGFEIDFTCSTPDKCQKQSSFLMSPCCRKDLFKMIVYVRNVCQKGHVLCEVTSGTLLGALKLNNILPWEWDADFAYLLSNFTALDKIRDDLSYSELRYEMGRQVDPKYENNNGTLLKAGFAIHNTHWVVELYGWKNLSSANNKLGHTLVRIGNEWFPTMLNPGKWCRERFGKNIYKHVQHWRLFGSKDYLFEYRSNKFAPCTQPRDHKCTDNYKVDGNLQFMNILP